MTEKQSAVRRFADKVYGGINMSWVKVLLIAAASAIVTAVFLIVPIFSNTSFMNMGTYFEAWFFLAILIMVNCKSPLDSAVKTFVFFLISQPLIYLLQVPFSELGFGLFGYYRTWFLWTLATFPMAFVGWYLRKRNWLSLLILAPVLVAMAIFGTGYLKAAIDWFPHNLLSALFCYGQILLYLYVFFDDPWQRLSGLGAALIAGVIFVILYGGVSVGVSQPLDGVSLSDQAVIALADSSYGEAEIVDAEGGYIHVHMTKYGSTLMTVTDGDRVYTYLVEAKMVNGTSLIDITPIPDQQNTDG